MIGKLFTRKEVVNISGYGSKENVTNLWLYVLSPFVSLRHTWLRRSWWIETSQDGKCFFHFTELLWISRCFANYWDDSTFHVFQGGKVKCGITDFVILKLFVGTRTCLVLILARDIKHQLCQLCEYPGYLVSGCLLKYFSCFVSLGQKRLRLTPDCLICDGGSKSIQPMYFL